MGPISAPLEPPEPPELSELELEPGATVVDDLRVGASVGTQPPPSLAGQSSLCSMPQ